MSKSYEHVVKIFGMTNQIVTEELSLVAEKYGVVLGHTVDVPAKDKEQYYSQFDLIVRSEAEEMSNHYKLFYCIESSIRDLVSDTITDAEGPSWWDSDRVCDRLKTDVLKRIKREQDSGVTIRSTD